MTAVALRFPWRIFLAVSGWAMFILLPLLVNPIEPPSKPFWPPPGAISPWKPILFNGIIVGLFYINTLWLIPRILEQRGLKPYMLAVVGCVFLVMALFFGIQATTMGMRFVTFRMVFISIVPSVLILSISTTYKVLSDYHQRQQRQKELENEQLRAELSFLRSQISPHFLFNVLNSIVSLARLRPKDVEPVTIQLAGLLRYMLYESDNVTVRVEQEIDYMHNFIRLERLRSGTKVQIDFTVDVPDQTLLIEPMLLIPFVENAFKHGVGGIANPVVQIGLRSVGTSLYLHVRNRLSDKPAAPPSGIGLRNVTRRLNLLYPDKHDLRIEQAEGWYDVQLTLLLR
ncbi:sensor histidine kinase [Spirosoma montaniterrae]|uniref:Signal transduction histidine kinase internal region domain-containing protein n=1 Tax=Spirosoma montaniterrae TaxID=1178516 RepID=A0A1P9WYH6_9BACT|nr:histidine kinase [Spirosoma montaniterrae]AQG80414.1 hypothetical protein AWR27_14435 [Spirosoma montaniterrae]